MTARSYSLDIARAAAISLVLVRHGYAVVHQEGQGQAESWAANLMSNGWLGVDLFFVLSGFLLSRQLIGEMAHAGRIDLGAFWRRRLLRILPCYLVVILATWAFLQYGPISGIEVGYLELLVHLFFLQDYAGSVLLVPSWSLATELKFYLLLPLLVWLLTSLTWKGAALVSCPADT